MGAGGRRTGSRYIVLGEKREVEREREEREREKSGGTGTERRKERGKRKKRRENVLRWCAAGIHPLSVPRAPSPPSLSLSPTPPSLSPPHPTLSLSLPHPAVDRLAVSTLVVPADHLAGGAGGGGRWRGGGEGPPGRRGENAADEGPHTLPVEGAGEDGEGGRSALRCPLVASPATPPSPAPTCCVRFSSTIVDLCDRRRLVLVTEYS